MPVSAATTGLSRRRIVPTVALASLAGSAVGYSACIMGGVLPAAPLAWLAFAAAGLLSGSAAAGLLRSPQAGPHPDTARAEALQQELAERAEHLRRLRHDLRGVLSPMLLIGDRLAASADPATKRSGDIMVQTVERATALLEESNPPADP